MLDNLIIPSVDARIGALEEYNRQRRVLGQNHVARKKRRPCITLSREFGCEGYPVAEKLCSLLAGQTGDRWLLVDREILDEVARRHQISQEVLQNLGEKNQFLAEVIATFSPRWRTDRDYFRLLCEHVVSMAEQGNVIILELGGACIARHLEDAHHIRLYASRQFKVRSIATRLELPEEEAEQLIDREQRQRDQFLRTFLGQDGHDPGLYDLMINNTNHAPQKIAQTIASFVLAGDEGHQQRKHSRPAEAANASGP